MPPSRQVFCTHCAQTFFCTDAYTCSLCGKAGGLKDPNGPEAMAGLAAKKHDPAPLGHKVGDGLGDAVHGALAAWRLLKLATAGLVGLGVGVALLVIPDLREDSRGLSARDFLVAIGPLIVGVVLLGWVGWSWWRSRSTEPDA